MVFAKKDALVLSALCSILVLVVLYPPNVLDVPAIFQPKEIKPVKITRPMPPFNQTPRPSAPETATENMPLAKQHPETTSQPLQNNEVSIAPYDLSEPKPAPVHSTTPETNQLRPEVFTALNIPAQNLSQLLLHLDPQRSRQMALHAAIDMWQIPVKITPHLGAIEDNETFFRLAAKQNGLTCQRINGNLELVKKLNLPAVLEFIIPDRVSTGYLTLSKVDEGRVTLMDGTKQGITTDLEDLTSYWSGVAYIPWKNFLACTGEIPNYASEDSIVTLKMILKDIGYQHITIDAFYNKPAQEAVKEIQKKHGLLPDGVVGPLTKIVLYNEHNVFQIPHIRINGIKPS